MKMLKKQEGFTLVELMITMIIFLLAITAASQMLVGIVTQFKQQSKIAETHTEGIIGLELLRADIEQAGFGLPWNMNTVTYLEAVDDATTPWNDTTNANDASNPPRGIVVDPGVGLNNSDVLVVKATNVATNTAANKWTYISNTAAGNVVQTWGSAQDNLLDTDRVSVMSPYSSGQQRVLASAGGNYPKAAELTYAVARTDVNYLPVPNSFESTLVYGIAPISGFKVRMPFNRADYYIRTPGTMPARCAPNTGVLYKGVIINNDDATTGGRHTELPLLDCVLDMRVVVIADTGTVTAPNPVNWTGAGWPTSSPTSATAAPTVRNQTREVRVYIVAQEGQMDPSYTFRNPIPVASRQAGCLDDNQLCIIDSNAGLLRNPAMVPDPNYRWKIYTLVSTPYNLK